MTDLRLKCTKFDFGWGSAPDPAGGAYSAPPDPLAEFGGPLRGRGRCWAGEDEGKGREWKWRGRKRRAPKLLLNQGPSEPCYATAPMVNKLVPQR